MPKKTYISPQPKAYAITPVALERDIAVRNQIRFDEETIRWGDFDDLPLRIMQAVNKSQTAISCLSTRENFIAGSGFTDEGLMTHPIDEDGTTLWDFHTQLCPYLTLLEAFAVNFKFDREARITNAFVVGAESCRFVRPPDKSKKISIIKFNPYFGTAEYNAEYTRPYPVFDIVGAKEQVKYIDDKYQGQIFFFGTVRPPHKFYPVPKYWSGEEWIYADAGIKTYHKSNLDNGFFNSAMINVIGNPNQPSKNPKYMREVTGSDNVKRKESFKTVGEEFDEQIGESLAGTRKGGTAWVVWSLNKDQAINVQAFPVNANADILTGVFNDAIKGICIATEIDPILLTLQNNGLSNAGDSVRAVIEYTQSKVARQQTVLETFYNKVLLPNLQNKVKQEVKIKNYLPIQTQVTVEDKFWNELSKDERKDFIKQNVQGMSEIIKESAPIVDDNGEPLTPQEEILSDNLKDLNMRQIYRLNKISQQYAKGEITEAQAIVLIKGFGFSDQEARAWLGLPMEAAKV